MRLLSGRYQGQPCIGLLVSDKRVLLLDHTANWPQQYDSLLTVIKAGDKGLRVVKERARRPDESCVVALDDVTLTAPIPRPDKNIICLGWNYAEHAKETSKVRNLTSSLPEHPIVFTKSVTSVNAPEGVIPYDDTISEQLDWEVELAVIIGKQGKGIKREHALDHVFGYTIVNDISARDLQMRHKQYFLGKSLDGACPMGPWVVTRDALSDPQNLELICRVNGVTKQQGNTRDQIFTVADTIARLSHIMRLEPGDIIATGTPEGVGFARTPPEFLKPGDVVECEIPVIGVLRNYVEAVDA